MDTDDPGYNDEVLSALQDLIDVLENGSLHLEIGERAQLVARLRRDGLSYSEIADRELRPLIVEMIGTHVSSLVDATGRLRRAQARALHDEGLTMAQIAELFGVTRQRISQLINGADRASRGPGDVS